MPIFEETWQTYAIGTALPTGPWTGGGGVIVAGGDLIPGTDRHAFISGSSRYIQSTYEASFTTWVAIRPFPGTPRAALALINQTNGNWVNINIELDGSITAFSNIAGGIILQNSFDHVVNWASFNLLQINVTFSIVTISLTNFLRISVDVALNGVPVISTALTTGHVVSGGPFGVNTWEIANNDYGDFVVDNLTALVGYPHPGTPNLKAFQGAIETLELPSAPNARIISSVLEISELPSAGHARIKQAMIELLLAPTSIAIIPEYIKRHNSHGNN